MSGPKAPTCLKKNFLVWTFRKKVIKKVHSFCYEPYYPQDISTSLGGDDNDVRNEIILVYTCINTIKSKQYLYVIYTALQYIPLFWTI